MTVFRDGIFRNDGADTRAKKVSGLGRWYEWGKTPGGFGAGPYRSVVRRQKWRDSVVLVPIISAWSILYKTLFGQNCVYFENHSYLGPQPRNAPVRGASGPNCQTAVSKVDAV